jgi:predicted nucleic acid-binding protein
MRYLLDTNILLRILHHNDPSHQVVHDVLGALRRNGHTFATTRQNIAEFWNVCTRPANARGGFGLSITETNSRLQTLEIMVEVLTEADTAYTRWKNLLTHHGVSGLQVYDARIVAVMGSHNISHLVSFNIVDFQRYNGIAAATPQTILATLPNP